MFIIEAYQVVKDEEGNELPLAWVEVSRHSSFVDAENQLLLFIERGMTVRHKS